MLNSWMTRAVLGRTSVGNPLQPVSKPDAAFEATWRRPFKTRLLLMLAAVVSWAVLLEARLVHLQVLSHDEFVAKAKGQQEDLIVSDPGRGEIRDRSGRLIAITVESYRVIADPSVITNPAEEAREICDALMDCTVEERAQLVQRLSSPKSKKYAPVRSSRAMSAQSGMRLERLIQQRIADKKPAVLSLIPESRRYYPNKEIAGAVVGAVGADGNGVSGLERRYDGTIKGAPGLVRVLFDAGRQEMNSIVERAPTAGAAMELTIDLRLQYIAEKELAAAVKQYQAAGGSVVIMQPFTGEILAQASYPPFNPNNSGAYADEQRVNPTVQSTYEPGSTFKMVTASAALNEGLLKPQDLIDTNPGYVKFEGRKPITESNGHKYGVLTFENVLIKSSNVGAIRIADRIGSERLLDYIHRFGFDQKLGPDFLGLSKGQLRPGPMNDSSRASISMGYEIGVTPLQVATAASVIANGGLLMEPRVLRATVRDGVRSPIEPKVVRRVITPETAATMTTIMEGVVSSGTATAAALTRYRVAGKTGTAKKVVGRGYSETDYNVSFVGFVPSNKPELTILVVLDTPRNGRPFGGTMAAPTFKRIAEAALQQIGVAPSINPAPPIISASNPRPPAAPVVPDGEPIITHVGGRPIMPDMRGLSLRAAIRLANELGIYMKTTGDGTVVEQTPAPGEFVDRGSSGALQLQRHSPVRGGR